MKTLIKNAIKKTAIAMFKAVPPKPADVQRFLADPNEYQEKALDQYGQTTNALGWVYVYGRILKSDKIQHTVAATVAGITAVSLFHHANVAYHAKEIKLANKEA